MKTKNMIFVTGIILCALFVCTASASGKDHLTKGDLNDFIDSIWPKDKEETEHVVETATESARTVIKNGFKTEGKRMMCLYTR
jgi:hypothetical protein